MSWPRARRTSSARHSARSLTGRRRGAKKDRAGRPNASTPSPSSAEPKASSAAAVSRSTTANEQRGHRLDNGTTDHRSTRTGNGTVPIVPLLRHSARPHDDRPRDVAYVRKLPETGSDRAHGAVLPVARVRVRAVLSGPARGVRGAG